MHNREITRRRFMEKTAALAGGILLSPLAAQAAARKTAVDQVTLGRTGLRLSRLGIGCGTRGGRVQQQLGQDGFNRLIRYAYDQGISYIDIANFTEIAGGRSTESGGVAFDLSHVSPGVIEKEASIPFKYFMSKGVDIRKEPLQIAPSIQHMNGGILINEKGETNIPGLYAAGEAAGGPHGSDRPGGNSLADCQVFGARAGRHAAERARRRSLTADVERAKEIEDELSALQKPTGSSRLREEKVEVGDAVTEFREMMWRNVSVVRNEDTLREAKRKLLRFKELGVSWLKAQGLGLVEAVELRNMVDVGLAIAASALMRRETRGSHYRTDYPLRNDEDWLKMIEVKMVRQDLEVSVREPYMLIHP